MHLKLGDIVIRKDDQVNILFQVKGFDGDYAILKGIEVPIMTIVNINKLIKLNRKRRKFSSGLDCIK